jgi:hypothetical protein
MVQQIFKLILVTIFKILAYLLGFCFELSGKILILISETLYKIKKS